MLKNKLKNNKGSSIILVTVVMVLVTMLVGTIYTQLNNQVKSNRKTEKYIQSKYESQAGIENGIAKFINSINVTGKLNSSTSSIGDKYIDIVLHYINQAAYINGNQGSIKHNIDTIIKEINNLNNSNLPLDKAKEKYNLIDENINTAIKQLEDKVNNVEKQLVYDELIYAKEYLRILQLDMINENVLSNIKYIINRLNSNTELCKRDIKNDLKVSTSEIRNHFDDLKNRLYSISQNIGSTGQYSEYIEDIYKFEQRIQAIIDEMTTQKELILVDNIKQYYQNGNPNNNGNGNSNNNNNKNLFDIVNNRMNIIKLELELLRENILFLKDGITSGGNSGESGSSNGSNISNKLIVTIPKEIDNIMDEELDYKSKVNIDECKLNDGIYIKSLDDKYEVEVISTDAIIEIGLSIESKNEDYTTNSKVNIIISNIKNKEAYDVKYKVVSWN